MSRSAVLFLAAVSFALSGCEFSCQCQMPKITFPSQVCAWSQTAALNAYEAKNPTESDCSCTATTQLCSNPVP